MKNTISLLLTFFLIVIVTYAAPHYPGRKFAKAKKSMTSPPIIQMDKTASVIERPILIASFDWDSASGNWGDTTESIKISWNAYGVPDKMEMLTENYYGPGVMKFYGSDFTVLNQTKCPLNNLVSTKEIFKEWIPNRWVPRSVLIKVWNGTAWVDTLRYTTKYDYNTRILSDITQNLQNNKWVDKILDTNKYNEAGDEIYYSEYTDNGSGWEMSNLEILNQLKNSKGQLEGVEETAWDYFADSIYLRRKEKYNLDASGKITTVVTHVWDKSKKQFVKWDSTGNITWDIFDPGRIDYTREESTFFVGGPAFATMEFFEWGGSDWENNSKHYRIFNADHTLKSFKSQNMRNGWEYYRGTADYYPNKDFKESIAEMQNGANWDIAEKQFFDNNYDAEGSLTESVSREWKSGKYENVQKTIVQYTSVNAINDGKAMAKEFTIYPNPASTVLSIVPKSQAGNLIVRIWSVTGKEMRVLADINNGITKLDISSLPLGMYILQTEIDGIRQVGKFVKE